MTVSLCKCPSGRVGGGLTPAGYTLASRPTAETPAEFTFFSAQPPVIVPPDPGFTIVTPEERADDPFPFPPPPPLPSPSGPPAVNLGTAAGFKILAKSGITNVPPSTVIGNMGVSPIAASSITGFALVLDGSGTFSTSPQVTERVYAADYAPPTPANLTQAVLDMEAAFTDAMGRAPNFFDVAAGLIGGLTFIPGVYRWNSNVNIMSDIVLVGGPDDTWIFQVTGTLDVASGVNIVLAGGASPRNIVWVVAGATTIGTNASFMGTILDQTNIAVQTGASVNGNLLAQTAVTLDQNIIDP